jgi:hypothetical protein
MNHSGHYAMIARQAVPASEMLYRSGHQSRDVFDTYARSHDGRWTAPGNLAELNRIFPEYKNPANMLRGDGGLTTLTRIDALSMGSSYHAGLRFAHATQPASTLDAIIDAGAYANIHFPSIGTTLVVNNAYFLPVFLDRTQGMEDMPREAISSLYGSAYRYKPTHVNQFPEALILNDGDVLDLTGLVDTQHGNRTEINVVGNAKIIGNGNTLYHTHIALHDAHLTLQDIAINGAGPFSGAALMTRSPASQIRVVGMVGLVGSHYGVHSFRGNKLSMFGYIAGYPELNMTGDIFALHVSGFEAQDMTVNLTVKSGSGFDSYHSPAPAFENCTVNFYGITSNPRAYFYRCTVNGFLPVTGPLQYHADRESSITYAYHSDIRIGGNDSNIVTVRFIARDKAYAGTNDDIRVQLSGETIRQNTMSEWVNMGAINRDALREYNFTLNHTFISGFENHIRLHKPGNDGVDLASIRVYPRFSAINYGRPFLYSDYGSLKWDDGHVHVLFSKTQFEFVPRELAGERVAQALDWMIASYSSPYDELLSRQALRLHMLEVVADLAENEVAHVPVALYGGFEPDGSILRALSRSEGRLQFNLFEGGEKWLSWVFCSRLLEGADLDIDALKVGLEIGRPPAMGFPNLPAVATILRFEKSDRLPGLERIVLHDSEQFRLAAGERLGLYRIVDGRMERIANDLMVDDLYRLSFTPDDFSHDFALVRRYNDTGQTFQPPGTQPPPTGQPTDTTMVVIHNGEIIPATIGEDGITFIFTAEAITENRDNSGGYIIEITGRDEVGISLPIPALNGDGLTVITNFGTINLNPEALQAIREMTGDILRLVAERGSIRVKLLDSDDREVAYNNPSAPLFIRLPVTPVADASTDGYIAARMTASGNVTMPYSIYSSGEVIFKTPMTGTFDIAYNGRTFNDISGHWALSNITFVAARGLFGGIGNDLFRPGTPMTRAMFAQVLANIEGVNLSAFTTSRFADVPVGAWYAPAVEWAASAGIVSGVGDNRFDPEANITREQMAVMLNNYITWTGKKLTANTEFSVFMDEAAIGSWALEGVKAIQAYGIIVGKPGNLFDPKATATRAEVATIFARYIEVAVNRDLHGS